MATRPESKLIFYNSGTACFECGERITELPPMLPEVHDDFDWRVRDFDGYLKFMLDELAARFPERTRWTTADKEVVILEALAASLDQLSDMSDRVFAEGFLETARRPDSVRRLLSLIGYDAVRITALDHDDFTIPPTASLEQANRALERYWREHPHAMNAAKKAGPKRIRQQRRMVSLDDYVSGMQAHPMVAIAKSSEAWTGSWSSLLVAVIPYKTGLTLDSEIPQSGQNASETRAIRSIIDATNRFNLERGLAAPNWEQTPSLRTILRPYIDAYRLAGQEVILRDAVAVGITIIASLNVSPGYFVSEVKSAARAALGQSEGGFFAAGRLRFGEDIFASDIIVHLMKIDGVDNACLIRFGRTGSKAENSDRISLSGLELAICDNDRADMSRGYSRVTINGGQAG